MKYSALEELESALAACFKQACASSVSINNSVVSKKALKVAAFL
jgi:hypothetical protein